MTLAHRGSLAVDAAEPAYYVVRASGTLDRSTATRVVRLVDARARLATLNFTTTQHILVDLSGVTQVEPGALELLRHARHSAVGAGMTLHLTGCDAVVAGLGLRERQALATLPRFPTVAVAVEVLG
ncbi:MAG TPA: STAS domain-containing protein [Pseudonocardia sp.]